MVKFQQKKNYDMNFTLYNNLSEFVCKAKYCASLLIYLLTFNVNRTGS